MNWKTADKRYASIVAMAALLAFMTTVIGARAGTRPGSASDAMLRQGSLAAQAPEDDQLHSELLMELVFERGTASKAGFPGGSRSIVPVAGGTFKGPGLEGTIGNPSGDWIVSRPDSSSLLDMRMVLKTDDSATIYMTWRGIAYAEPNGALFARVLPMFETSAPKYAWLNKVVAVGVYRPVSGKISYRMYRIL